MKLGRNAARRDLNQAGLEGLRTAAEKFTDGGSRFSSYATMW